MTFYQMLAKYGPRYVKKSLLFRYGMNWSPMYRRTTGRFVYVSEDLLRADIEIPISYRNRNYVGALFGGSMFAAADPLPMALLVNLLNNDYVVWDKAAAVRFKAPAFEDVVASFAYTQEEVVAIREQVDRDGEMEWLKTVQYTTRDRGTVICEIDKTLYIATKAHYKAKRKARSNRKIVLE